MDCSRSFAEQDDGGAMIPALAKGAGRRDQVVDRSRRHFTRSRDRVEQRFRCGSFLELHTDRLILGDIFVNWWFDFRETTKDPISALISFSWTGVGALSVE